MLTIYMLSYIYYNFNDFFNVIVVKWAGQSGSVGRNCGGRSESSDARVRRHP